MWRGFFFVRHASRRRPAYREVVSQVLVVVDDKSTADTQSSESAAFTISSSIIC
jgi:hypothetical protein